MAEVHEKKNDDYTTSGVFENFERMAQISSWFVDDIDKVFATMVAVKLARLGSLLGRKNPKNESILDTFKDMTIYAGLWTAFHMEQTELDTERKVLYDKQQCKATIEWYDGKKLTCVLNNGHSGPHDAGFR